MGRVEDVDIPAALQSVWRNTVAQEDAVNQLVEKYSDVIVGHLTGFDRLVMRRCTVIDGDGYPPNSSQVSANRLAFKH